MKEKQSAPDQYTGPGLCAECAHSRRVESERKSFFILCELSFNDPRFPKYPRLPVLSCKGYKKKAARG
jgi:hypothetical protein